VRMTWGSFMRHSSGSGVPSRIDQSSVTAWSLWVAFKHGRNTRGILRGSALHGKVLILHTRSYIHLAGMRLALRMELRRPRG